MLFLIQVQEKKNSLLPLTQKGLRKWDWIPSSPLIHSLSFLKKNLVKGRKYASEKKNTRRRPSAITLESWEVENEKAIGLSFTATMAFYERD